MAGQYRNLATVTGTDPIGQTRTATDPSHYFGVRSEIRVEKATNGQDADLPTGPLVAAGSTVTWTYAVTNPGNVPLANVVLRDNNGTPGSTADDFTPTFLGGDTNNNGLLEPGETWSYRATGVAIVGQYANLATASGRDPLGQTLTATDPSHYFGVRSEIRVEKATNGQDADLPTGPLVPAGSTVTWTYAVTNPGNVPLANVVLRDNNGTPGNAADDFTPTFLGGDVNSNGLLEPGETWSYQATGVAIVGQYENVATASGRDPLDQTRTATDPSHYFGVQAAIEIVKLTNGTNNDTPPGPAIQLGSIVTWTYLVSNPGNVPLRNVAVTDDQPGVVPQPVLVGGFNTGDTNTNNLLDPGEVWVYTATGIAVEGQYVNVGTARGEDSTGTIPGIEEAENPDYYFGVDKPPVIVLGPDKNPGKPQYVTVVNSESGEILTRFVAYEADYLGGTRVAVADLDGDGTEEIITAPGRNRSPEIRVFDLEGKALPGFPGFLAYDAAFIGGVHLTVADVNGDGKPDVITVPSYGAADVRVFLNRYPQTPAFQATPDITFRAFPTATLGGAVVTAADMGSMVGGSFVNVPDGKAEIVVGTGPGSKATVSVFDVSQAAPVRVQTFFPFTVLNPNFPGGVSLDVARINADAIPDLVVGMGVNGLSRIEVWAWDTAAVSLSMLGAIPDAFTGSSNNAPVNVAAQDSNGDGIADRILAVQGPIGTTGEIRRFDITGTSPFQYLPASPLTGFYGPWFIASRRAAAPAPPSQPEPIVPPAVNVWTNPVDPYDVNDSRSITPLDVLETINYINRNPGTTALPAEQFAPPRYFDVNVDGAITANDVLLLVNVLSRPAAEGESILSAEPRVAGFPPLDTASGSERSSSPSALVEIRHDSTFAALDAALVPGTEWVGPQADEASPRGPTAAKTPLDDLDPLDLESILEDIAAEIAAPGN